MSDAVGSSSRSEKSASAFRTISEVSQDLDVPQHVLRFWETKFSQVKPLKRAGGRRYYRPEDISLLRCIRDLLYADGFTIRGVQKRLREKGVKGLIAEMESGSAGNTVPQDFAVPADRQAQEEPSASEPSKVQIDALRSAEAAPSQTAERPSANKAELQSVKEDLENLLHDVRTARQSS